MATMTVSEDVPAFAQGQFSQYQSTRFTPTTGLKTASPSNSSSMGEQDNGDKGATSHSSLSHAQQSSATSTSAPTPQFGVLDLSPQVGVLGPPKDGRVSRDAVPTKLKGKMDQKNGNFGVMHMDIGSRAEPQKQSVAAQRTSENTALAAEVAQREGYISLKKRRLEAQKPPQPVVAQTIRPHPAPPPSQPYIPRTEPLTAEQAKYEQARLLTLLRSINPLTVVDQLCKALAFFGGIPSAPPPVDGRFPQSAEANGEGKLFLGWISEIFPDLEKKEGWKKEEPVAPEINVGRRPRGRPKGSKARKVRSDKGIKKGPLSAARKDSQGNPQESNGEAGHGEADDGWVDVGDTEAQNANANDADTMDVDVLEVVEPTSSAADPENPKTQDSMSTPVAKNKGGRPRGSRNKPKSTESTPQHPQSQMQHDLGLGIPPPPPGVMQVLARTLADVQPSGGFSGSPSTETPDSSQRMKNKGGRPKGSKNKPKDGPIGLSTPMSSEMMADLQASTESPTMQGGSRRPNSTADPFANMSQVPLTTEELAVLQAMRAVRAQQTPAPAPPPETKKRKRAPRPSAASKAAAAAAAASSATASTSLENGVENTGSEPATVNGNSQPISMIPDNQGQNGATGSLHLSVNENMAGNKGQRNTKDSKPTANKRQSSQNVLNNTKEKLADAHNSGVATSMSSPQLSLPTTSTPTQPINAQVQPKRPSSQTSHYQPQHQPQQHQFTSLNANHNHPQSQQVAQVAMQALQQSQNRQSQQSPIQTANTSASYFSQPHQAPHALSRPGSTHATTYSPYSTIPSLQQSGRQYSHSHSLSDSLQNDGSGHPNPYSSPSMSNNNNVVQSGNLNVGGNQGSNVRNPLSVQQHGPPKQPNSFGTSTNPNMHPTSQNSRHQQNPQSSLSGVLQQQNPHSSGTGTNHNSGQEKRGGNPDPYSYSYTDTSGYLDLGGSSSSVGHSHISNNNHSHSMSNSLSDGALGHNMFHSSQVGVSNRGGGTGNTGIGDIGFGGSGGGVGNGYDLGSGSIDNDLRDRLLGGLGRR